MPALTAVLAGALVAGVATIVSDPVARPSADQLRVELTGDQSRSSEPGVPETTSSSTAPASASTTTGRSSSTTPPPPPTSSSTPVETAPPPPPETTTPPASPAPPGGSFQDQVVSLTNAARQDAGCGPLTADPELADAAQGHAQDMSARDYFSHTTPEGVTFDQRIRNAGYSKPGAENIARGATTAESVTQMWLDSPGHRANILNCELNAIGVGLDRDGFYWVQNFGF